MNDRRFDGELVSVERRSGKKGSAADNQASVRFRRTKKRDNGYAYVWTLAYT